MDYFNKTIMSIDDIILIDFARDKFDNLRDELLNDEGVTDIEMNVYSKKNRKQSKKYYR
ncbi:hypothetical protein OGZ02_00040 [Brachyspira hyodysenteriae]|nr:hypothetical protein [Brachyspira hyodysenteriae]MDA1467267.1 hypothetical protein [Brachyspira hyodysenteriae]